MKNIRRWTATVLCLVLLLSCMPALAAKVTSSKVVMTPAGGYLVLQTNEPVNNVKVFVDSEDCEYYYADTAQTIIVVRVMMGKGQWQLVDENGQQIGKGGWSCMDDNYFYQDQRCAEIDMKYYEFLYGEINDVPVLRAFDLAAPDMTYQSDEYLKLGEGETIAESALRAAFEQDESLGIYNAETDTKSVVFQYSAQLYASAYVLKALKKNTPQVDAILQIFENMRPRDDLYKTEKELTSAVVFAGKLIPEVQAQ